MNTEQAKLILGAIHRDAGHAPDPDAEQALALLEKDEHLHAWFERECELDEAVASKLAEVNPPAELRASLVSLLEENRAGGATANSDKTTWLRPQFLAAAAAVALVSIVLIQLFSGNARANEFEEFRSDMAAVAAAGISGLAHRGESLAELSEWLAEKNAATPADLPACVACAKGIGCKVFEWNGNEVSLICMVNKSSQVVHCFIIARSQLVGLPDENDLRNILTEADRETCAWSDAKNVYLLVGSEPGVKVMAVE